MPMINIKYDNNMVSDDNIANLSIAIRDIVSDVTKINDVFVYADSPKIKIKIAPIEIFVEMSSGKIKDLDGLTKVIREHLSLWKVKNGFNIPINLSVIPMNWKVEIAI